MNSRNRRKLNTLLILGLYIIFLLCMTVTQPLVASAASGSTTVYVTDYGDKYHRSSCQYLHSSKNAISLSTAVNRGYTPCSKCDPPRLTSNGGGTTQTPTYPSTTTREEDDERWIPIFWAVVIALGGGGYITYSIIKDRREQRRIDEIEEDEEEEESNP